MKRRESYFLFRAFNVLILIVLILGVYLRFVNIDRKVYWPDETFTSLRISGYTEKEMIQDVYNGRVVNIRDLQKYQHINSQKTLIDTIKGLAREEPQQTPLYYLMAKFWVQFFGESVAVTRSLSAWISLLAFPCIYWLCIELFDSRVTGWIAISLLAVSPFHVLYAQEARNPALWTVSILFSNAALLRAMRLKTNFNWGIYGASLAISLYSFLLSGLVFIGHTIYVLVIENFRLSKTVIAYLCASFAGLLAFSPWLLAIITNLSEVNTTTDWATTKVSLISLAIMWVGNFSRIFFDIGVGSGTHLNQMIPAIPPTILIMLLLGYAVYYICRHTPRRIWLFILISIGVSATAFVLPDLIFGGRRSGVARYLIPCYLGFQLAVAHLLAIHTYARSRRRKFWYLIILTLTIGGLFSCAISANAQVWWNKGPDRTRYNFQIAHLVNQASQPLLISDTTPDVVLSLTYLLAPKVRFQLAIKPNIPKIADGFRDVFLYRCSDKLRSEIEKKQNYHIEPAFENQNIYLWKLRKP